MQQVMINLSQVITFMQIFDKSAELYMIHSNFQGCHFKKLSFPFPTYCCPDHQSNITQSQGDVLQSRIFHTHRLIASKTYTYANTSSSVQ